MQPKEKIRGYITFEGIEEMNEKLLRLLALLEEATQITEELKDLKITVKY